MSATRLAALDADETLPRPQEAAEATDGAQALLVSSFEGVVRPPQQPHDHALRILVRKTTAPKCPRCWRHVPTAAAFDETESVTLEDGWIVRGHPDAACKQWIEAADASEAGT